MHHHHFFSAGGIVLALIFQIILMTTKHNENVNKFSEDPRKTNETGDESKREITNDSEDNEPFTAGNNTPEIATNDGSVIETLDTAFHGKPGWSEGENLSGSNRADYYEARSNGKSDAEEELDELRQRNKSADSKTQD
jgi:hypothetical protein